MEKPGVGGLDLTIVPSADISLGDIKEVYLTSGVGEGKKIAVTLLGDGKFTARNLVEGRCYVTVLGKEERLLGFYRADVEPGKNTEYSLELPRAEGWPAR